MSAWMLPPRRPGLPVPQVAHQDTGSRALRDGRGLVETRRWFTEESISEACKEPEHRKPVPKPRYEGAAAEHAARIIALVLSGNVASIDKAA